MCHDNESLSPAGPDSGEPDPDEAIDCPELRSADRSFINGKLLAESEVSRASWRWPPNRKGRNRNTWSRRVIIEPDCCRMRPIDQLLGCPTAFWRRTGRPH